MVIKRLTVLLLILGIHQARGLAAAQPAVDLPFVEADPLRKPLPAGAAAPDFTLPLAPDCHWKPTVKSSARPGTMQLSAVGKGVTLLVFWAFWCDTWKDITHDLKHLRPELSKAGVHPVCVAVDASQQPVATSAFASGDIWYPVVVDQQARTSARYGVRRVPTLFLLVNGHIKATFEGFPGEQTLMRAIAKARRGGSRVHATNHARSARTCQGSGGVRR